MTRLFFRADNRLTAARILFGEEDGFSPARYEIYEELEVCIQTDGRFSVWGDLPNDADLLRDTKPDPKGLVERLRPIADETAEE